MEIIFLGTGTSLGVPIIGCKCKVCMSKNSRDKRLRSSVFVKTDNNVNIVIDTGTDFRTQILRENITRVDAVFITHPHRDHLAGLDDIRPFNYMYKKNMPVYGNENTCKHIKNEFFYSFAVPRYPGVPEIDLHQVGDEPFYVKGEKIVPINVLHYKMEVLGFRIGNFSYITDASYISDEELEKIKDSDVLVINALRKRDPHISHFILPQALEIIKKTSPKMAYLTHVSHAIGLYNDTEKNLPKNVHLAYDGLKISL